MLNFVEVLVTNDYCLGTQSRHIGAKLVGMPHHANLPNPNYGNCFYDYHVGDKPYLSEFDYSLIPDGSKIHRKPHFTLLVAGHPKIDLILEERQRSASGISSSVFLLYPTYVDISINHQNISPDKYVEIWSEAISAILAWRPEGVIVFRPTKPDRHHPLVEQLKAKFTPSGRFFLDEDDDNKFWLSRADSFITDFSYGFINFCMTAKKPVIRLLWNWEAGEPVLDEWGYTIGDPAQLVPVLQEVERREDHWRAALAEKQEREMPTLGRNFALLAGMIRRILQDDDDPAWLRMDKGHTPSLVVGDKLRLMAKLTKRSWYGLRHMDYWLHQVLQIQAAQESPKLWLPLLRRALLPDHAKDTPPHIALVADRYLANALESLPLTQSVGLLRYLLRKYPQESALPLLLIATSQHVSGPGKKRALFFLLMEWGAYDEKVMAQVKDLANRMPQHFSWPVLDKLNRFLPQAMKIPLSLRRSAARILGLRKALARRYWQAHRALS